MNLGVSGHRPPLWGGYRHNAAHEWVKGILTQEIIRLRPTCLITGMAQGVDIWAAEIAISLQLPFVAVIPFRGQDSQWPPAARGRYAALLEEAQEVICLHETDRYEPEYLRERNLRMLTLSDEVLFVLWKRESGTKSTLDQAVRLRKQVHILGDNPPLPVVQAVNSRLPSGVEPMRMTGAIPPSFGSSQLDARTAQLRLYEAAIASEGMRIGTLSASDLGELFDLTDYPRENRVQGRASSSREARPPRPLRPTHVDAVPENAAALHRTFDANFTTLAFTNEQMGFERLPDGRIQVVNGMPEDERADHSSSRRVRPAVKAAAIEAAKVRTAKADAEEEKPATFKRILDF